MQICKSCRKEIEIDATKCSYCQAYQSWYKNPQIYSFVIMLPFIIFMFWNTGLINKKSFSEIESDFTFTEIKVVDTNGSKTKLITYKVKNDTKYKWNHISYEVVSSHNGEILASITDSNYDWVIQPNSESLLTVKVAFIPNVNQWQFKIKDLRSDRY